MECGYYALDKIKKCIKVVIILTNACNFNCYYCKADQDRQRDAIQFMSRSHFIQLIKKFKK